MKKIISILCIFVLAASILCACGGSKETESKPAQNADTEKQTEAQTEKPTDATTEAAAKEPLDTGVLVDKVFDDLNVSIAYAGDIKVSLMDEDGNYTISFKLNNIDCSYVVNGYTGEIVSKNVPQDALQEPADSMDPFEKAINLGMDSIEGYSGGAENIQAAMADGIITVDFDWAGKHYTFHYDIAQDKLVD